MPPADQLEIHFPSVSAADAGRLADDLATFVRRSQPEINARVQRGSSDAQDLGTAVVLVLGTPAVIALAKGIADWIRRQGEPDIVIKSGKDEVIVRGGLTPDQKVEVIRTVLDKRAD